MNINVFFNDGSSDLITGTTWGQAVAYAEGTGKQISTLTNTPNTIVVLENTNVCYNVILKDPAVQQPLNYFVFESNLNNVFTWINNQSGKTLVNLGKQEKTIVTL
jgi:hypothetical protein